MSDDECESGLCLRDRRSCGTQYDAGDLCWTDYHCATKRDLCRSDDPCEASEGDFCTYSYGGAQRWECGMNDVATCD